MRMASGKRWMYGPSACPVLHTLNIPINQSSAGLSTSLHSPGNLITAVHLDYQPTIHHVADDRNINFCDLFFIFLKTQERREKQRDWLVAIAPLLCCLSQGTILFAVFSRKKQQLFLSNFMF